MTTPIDFYFDFSSPYGYLASHLIDDLAARHGRSVIWRPVLLGVVFKTTGVAPLAHVPLKGEYSSRDVARSARFLGLPYQEPREFPVATQHVARGYYWLADRDAQLARAFARACLHAYFVEDRNISQTETLRELAGSLAIDPQQFAEAVTRPECKERLKAENDDAMRRGVFGSPYFIVDGEPFWGVDRLPQIDKWLAEGGF